MTRNRKTGGFSTRRKQIVEKSKPFQLNNWDPALFFNKNNTNSTVAIIGPRRSGKSVLIRFLYEKYWKKQFDLTIVYTKCPSTADFYNEFVVSVNGDGALIRSCGFQPKIFDIIRDIQTQIMEQGEEPLKILMILDDAVDKTLRSEQAFSDIFLMGRHPSFNIQLIFASQTASALSPEQRGNLDLLITFKLTLRTDKDKLFKEFIGGLIDYDEMPPEYRNKEYRFLDKLNQVTCVDHSFMVIDFRNPHFTNFREVVQKYRVNI